MRTGFSSFCLCPQPLVMWPLAFPRPSSMVFHLIGAYLSFYSVMVFNWVLIIWKNETELHGPMKKVLRQKYCGVRGVTRTASLESTRSDYLHLDGRVGVLCGGARSGVKHPRLCQGSGTEAQSALCVGKWWEWAVLTGAQSACRRRGKHLKEQLQETPEAKAG